ncbi:MAG TPA: M23 family metallopeptidase, partial [Baekduia sp.]|nr:M23 family metallopeptidase [Baekduia sp.]
MPRLATVILAALALVLPAGAGAASPDRGRWRRPLPGPVVGSFSFDPSSPYERGRRRGIDLAGEPGTPVLASCAGVVTHAGTVPRWGVGVTLRCGDLVATELGLTRTAVARGAAVARATPVAPRWRGARSSVASGRGARCASAPAGRVTSRATSIRRRCWAT